MFEKLFDAILALVFTAMTIFSAPAIYHFVKREALMQVSRGLSSTYRFQKAIDPTVYDWEH